jgi:gliding motility-associated-like protein
MNSSSGQFSFKPDLLGAHTLTQRVREYRNGKLIGSVLRDIQIQVLPGSAPEVDASLDTPTLTNAKIVDGVLTTDCGTQSISFCFNIKSAKKGTVLKITDNKNVAIPSATLTYTNQGQDSVRGCFQWNLTPADTGTKVLIVIVKDSTCNNPGIAVSQAYTFVMEIKPPFGTPLSVNISKPSDTICEDIPFAVKNTTTGNPAQTVYAWVISDSFGVTGTHPNYTITWSTPGFKHFTLAAQNGPCTANDSETVYVVAKPIASFELPGNGCKDKPVLMYPSFNELAGYYWTVDEHTISDTAFVKDYNFHWSTPGKKYVTLNVRSLIGCNDDVFTDSINIRDPKAPIYGLGEPYYCLGTPVPLYTDEQSGNSYSWSPVTEFSDNNVANVNYLSRYTGKVFLKVIDAWGCIAESSADIEVKECCKLITPDAFTPNKDGYNDKFIIINRAEYKVNSFIIKNRWGNTVFETSNINDGWDGMYKGQLQDSGTYFYFVQYTCPMQDGVLSKGGDFILVR